MNAIKLLREMHADTKSRFKTILGSDEPTSAANQWSELLPILDLHEQLEDRFLYAPLFEEMGPGTALGDWDIQHSADVAIVKQLIQAVVDLDPSQPEWRMGVGRVMDALSKHVLDEEGQIFGRIEQLWGPERLAQAGEQMRNEQAGKAQPLQKQPKSKTQPAPNRR